MSPKIARLLMRVRPIELGELLKKILFVRRVETKIGNLNLWLDPVSNLGRELVATGVYEKDFSQRLNDIIRAGDVVIDMGANEGYFSVMSACLVGAGGHVFVVEPQARLWPVIIYNFLLNGLTNYTLIPYAAGEQSGFVDLILHPSLNSGSSTLVKDTRRRFLARQKAGVMTLTEIAKKYNVDRVRLLKIDIEGYEYFAIKGGREWLAGGAVENILIEFHPDQLRGLGVDKDDVTQMLRELGYERVSTGRFEHWKLAAAGAA